MTEIVRGEKELLAALKRLGTGKEIVKALRRAMRQAAAGIRRRAKAATPKSEQRTRPGKHLRDSYVIRQTKRKTGRIGYRIMMPPRDKIGISPKSKWYYPAHLEYGFARKSGYAREALSMTRNALNDNENEIVSDIVAAFFKGVERAWK